MLQDVSTTFLGSLAFHVFEDVGPRPPSIHFLLQDCRRVPLHFPLFGWFHRLYTDIMDASTLVLTFLKTLTSVHRISIDVAQGIAVFDFPFPRVLYSSITFADGIKPNRLSWHGLLPIGAKILSHAVGRAGWGLARTHQCLLWDYRCYPDNTLAESFTNFIVIGISNRGWTGA